MSIDSRTSEPEAEEFIIDGALASGSDLHPKRVACRLAFDPAAGGIVLAVVGLVGALAPGGLPAAHAVTRSLRAIERTNVVERGANDIEFVLTTNLPRIHAHVLEQVEGQRKKARWTSRAPLHNRHFSRERRPERQTGALRQRRQAYAKSCPSTPAFTSMRFAYTARAVTRTNTNRVSTSATCS